MEDGAREERDARAGRPPMRDGGVQDTPSSNGGNADPKHVSARTTPRPFKVYEQVARSLLEQVVDANLLPGAKLPPENRMLEQFGVGRASLREALRALEIFGLLTVRSGKGGGPVVNDVGPPDLARLMTFYLGLKGVRFGELMDAYWLIRESVVSLAVTRQSRSMVKTMQEALERANEAGSDEEARDELVAFHAALFKVPGGEVLAMLRDALREVVMLRVQTMPGQPLRPSGIRVQRDLLHAIERGDLDAAQRATKRYAKLSDAWYQAQIPGLFDEVVQWI